MTDLKTFAEAVYARPGVAPAVLRLQERYGADVNLLLAGAWLAQRGYRLDSRCAQELAAHCREWRADVLLPQRAVRQQLKRLAPALYPQALELELAMERWQLERMAAWLATAIDTEPRGAEARKECLLAANLGAALGSTSAAAEDAQASAAWRSELAQLASILHPV